MIVLSDHGCKRLRWRRLPWTVQYSLSVAESSLLWPNPVPPDLHDFAGFVEEVRLNLRSFAGFVKKSAADPSHWWVGVAVVVGLRQPLLARWCCDVLGPVMTLFILGVGLDGVVALLVALPSVRHAWSDADCHWRACTPCRELSTPPLPILLRRLGRCHMRLVPAGLHVGHSGYASNVVSLLEGFADVLFSYRCSLLADWRRGV